MSMAAMSAVSVLSRLEIASVEDDWVHQRAPASKMAADTASLAAVDMMSSELRIGKRATGELAAVWAIGADLARWASGRSATAHAARFPP
ncbi:MAG: hypothetical protein ACJA2W_003445 [Planctomycetota bacterium]|jgi:hypothetical protein